MIPSNVAVRVDSALPGRTLLASFMTARELRRSLGPSSGYNIEFVPHTPDDLLIVSPDVKALIERRLAAM